MPDHKLPDRLLSLGLIVLLLALGVLSFDRARRGRYDFHHFYLDAGYVWEHGTLNPDLDNPDPDRRRQLPFYLPVVPLALSPIAACGRLPGAVFWALAQVASLGFSLRLLRRWGTPHNPEVPAAAPLGVALLLALPALIEAARFNQLSFVVLALVLAGFAALDRNRFVAAGAIFGAAAVLKLLPAIFLPWLLLKRRWRAAGAFVVVSAALTLLPPLVVFGPHKTVAYHRQWLTHNLESARGMLDPQLAEHFLDRRNQSITQVVARLTWAEHPFPAPLQPVQLDPHTGAWIARALGAVLLCALLYATRRPWLRLATLRRHAEAAAFAIGMLVFSPLLRQYYLVWALPALVLLARVVAEGGSAAVRRLGWIGMGVWAAGMIAWIWPVTRVLGTHLVMLILMGGLLLAATRRGAHAVDCEVRDPRSMA